MTRYRYEDRPLSPEESRRVRQLEIEGVQGRIASLEEELKEARAEMVELASAPLPATHTVQVALNPGDPGYDEAPFQMDVLVHPGDFKRVNLKTPSHT